MKNINYKNKPLLIITLGSLLIIGMTGCKKLVEVDAPDYSLTSENVYNNDATAAAVLTGIYTTLNNFSPLRTQTVNSLSLVCGASADELTVYGGAANGNTALVQFYQNRLNSGLAASPGFTIWNDIYSKIYILNLAIERLHASNGLTPSVKLQLTGEAEFMRAFFYFYLVNLYGDIPLTTTSDYRTNSNLSRSSKEKVYEQIVSDLIDAQSKLSDSYVGSDAKTVTTERTRPNKWAATALLARVYLYTGEWGKAIDQSTAILGNTSKYNVGDINKAFLKNNNEAIWQLQPVNTGWNTEDARVFILPSTGPTSTSSADGYPVYLSSQLVSAFEVGDKRKASWVGSVSNSTTSPITIYYFPYKYKSAILNTPVTEYTMVLRLAEQYLIRSEARAQQGDFTGSKADLDVIRTRAGLQVTTASDKASLLSAIQHERQIELFTEWGHRWLDIKRTKKVEEIMSLVTPTKGSTWNSNWEWYPIPLYEITQNSNLAQNQGY